MAVAGVAGSDDGHLGIQQIPIEYIVSNVMM